MRLCSMKARAVSKSFSVSTGIARSVSHTKTDTSPTTNKTATGTFPSVSLPSFTGGLPVDVSLVAQLGHGGGSSLFSGVIHRQRQHSLFVDELDEPSAKLASCDFAKGDATSLYTFAVGARGHPFHRHEGHRVFVAISGSSGARLRFCSASPTELEKDPHLFLQRLRHVEIPPDCLFSVRFGGETWHQFLPLDARSGQPAFVALSVHTNELGGNLSDELKQQVISGEASIPSLTQLLPAAVSEQLASIPPDSLSVPTTRLRLDAPSESILAQACQLARVNAGRLRGAWTTASPLGMPGFQEGWGGEHVVRELHALPVDSLLQQSVNYGDKPSEKIHHEDTFQILLSLDASLLAKLSANGAIETDLFSTLHTLSATRLLSSVLEGFVNSPPEGVARLMAVRNVIVKPLGLRTSPLGCPVSSLLSPAQSNLFAGRFPVKHQLVDIADKHAQVVLGADDKHLKFRTCVGVRVIQSPADGDVDVGVERSSTPVQHVEITMSTHVYCLNLFGHFYMRAIDRVHRTYVSPTLLRTAVEYALR